MLKKLDRFSKFLLHQTAENDMPAEPVILVEVYDDVFVLSQEGREVLINYESIPDLIKCIKATKQEAVNAGLHTP